MATISSNHHRHHRSDYNYKSHRQSSHDIEGTHERLYNLEGSRDRILIVIILNRVDLSELEVEASLDFLLNDLNEALIGAFLVLMRAKGETYEEVVGLVKAMLKHALKVERLVDAVDIVGTGGDGANSVNISIGASILAVACGAKVPKVTCLFLQQGNSSSFLACGTADVLEEMGVVIDPEPEVVGIGFMMAPIYHPAMKAVRPIRNKLKVKIVFNVLGPMLNPARVPYAVVGVYAEDLDSGTAVGSIHHEALHGSQIGTLLCMHREGTPKYQLDPEIERTFRRLQRENQ
ncbi:hypothetical protein UlMin_027390, partial [Ulmus minor]